MNKIKSTIAAIVVGIIVGGGIGIGLISQSTQAQSWSEPTQETYRFLNLFGDVFDKIRALHVEEKTDKELVEQALRGMIKALDKHSSYLDPKQFKKMREETDGVFFGIGAEVSYKKDVLGGVIELNPMDGSPAQKAGLKSGDFIVEVDGKKVSEIDLFQGVDLIKGPKGTKVKLKIARKGVKEFFDIVVVRDRIKTIVVRSRIIQNRIMYIHLSSFNENSTDEIEKAIKKMNEEKPEFKCLAIGGCPKTDYEGLILDLRFNPGGLLNQASSVSDLFLDEGVIVYTKRRGGVVGSKSEASSGQAIPSDMPLVILVNQYSASASEIVAGALKDLKRATIIGVKTFGKGSVQSIIPLENDGALRLTIAKYYTASGATIHKVGITPDIVVDLKKHATDETKNEKFERGKDDTQILKAVEFLLSQ